MDHREAKDVRASATVRASRVLHRRPWTAAMADGLSLRLFGLSARADPRGALWEGGRLRRGRVSGAYRGLSSARPARRQSVGLRHVLPRAPDPLSSSGVRRHRHDQADSSAARTIARVLRRAVCSGPVDTRAGRAHGKVSDGSLHLSTSATQAAHRCRTLGRSASLALQTTGPALPPREGSASAPACGISVNTLSPNRAKRPFSSVFRITLKWPKHDSLLAREQVWASSQ